MSKLTVYRHQVLACTRAKTAISACSLGEKERAARSHARRQTSSHEAIFWPPDPRILIRGRKGPATASKHSGKWPRNKSILPYLTSPSRSFSRVRPSIRPSDQPSNKWPFLACSSAIDRVDDYSYRQTEVCDYISIFTPCVCVCV